MLKIFKREKHSLLEDINEKLKLNASNNYMDATIENLNELETEFERLKASGKLNEVQIRHYEDKIAGYKEEFRNFTHKAQKAGW